MMKIQINYSGIESSDSLTTHVHDRVEHALRHHGEHFSRVEVHLHDDNASKHGSDDKRALIEARPKGSDPIVVEDSADDVFKAISEAAKKLERSAQHFVERHHSR